MADLHGERFREMIEELDDGHIYGKRSRDSRDQGGVMKTEKIQRCIDNGSDIRDALAAQEELTAIETEIEATKQGECGHNWDRREWDACPVCALKDGVYIRISNLETALAAKDEAARALIKVAMDASAALDYDKEEILAGDLYAATEAAKAALSPPTGKVAEECQWLISQSREEGDIWQTDCGNEFVFNEGTPSYNGAKFCCYCGKKLVERVVEEVK